MQAGRHDGDAAPDFGEGGARPALAAGRPRSPLARVSMSCHEEYLRAFRPLGLEGFLLDRAERPWGVTRCRLRTVVVHHGVDAAPWAATGGAREGTIVLAFSAREDSAFRIDGHDAARDVVFLPPAGARATFVARRAGEWYAIALPEGSLPGSAAPGGAVRSGAPVPGRCRPADLARLRARIARTVAAFVAAPPSGPSMEASETAEAELVTAIAAIAAGLGAADEDGPRAAPSRVSRHEVLERVEALLAARSSEPVYVADLCAATGLPERTLRYVFAEQYGTSPIRLLRNRRLCQLRRALLSPSEPAESLSRLAARHGFWHMGTLAADYRRLFGELPSETRLAAEGAGRRESAARPLVRPAPLSPDGIPAAVARSAAGR